MGEEYMSSSNAVIPIILVLSFLSTIGVIYGALELSDDERNAWEVLKDLLSGKISLQDIWRVLSGRDAEAKAAGACQGVDQNGVYEYDKDGKCIKLGCNLGYYEQDNMCIERRNFSGEVFSGQGSADCELDPDEPYTYGQCLDEVKRVPLTGFPDSCGEGIRSKNPNVINGGIGLDSTCEEPSEEVCSVPCPKTCDAPEELWVPVEGAHCVGNGRHLGVPFDEGNGVEVTYHGEGLQLKKLREISEIPVNLYASTHVNAQEYADSINYDKCVDSVQKPCKIEATSTSKWKGCELPKTGIGWVSHNNSAVYTKESAEAYMADASKYGELKLEPAVSRDKAIELDVLDSKGQVLDLEKMPKGYIIKYKAINNQSYEQDLQNDCTIVQLVPAEAPRVAEDCEIENEVGACSPIGTCGAKYTRIITPVVKKQAWGVGVCNPGDPYTEAPSTCLTLELPCCEKGNSDHYKSGECSTEGIRTFTQNEANCSIQDLSGGKSSYKEDCCYVGDWEEAGCNLDGKLDHMKYTREIINKHECRNSDFSKGVNVDDDVFSYDYDKVNVKYVPNREDCYSTCAREWLDGVKPPYRQDWVGGGAEGPQSSPSKCVGTVKVRLSQEGKGSGKNDSSCTNYGLQNRKLGDTWTELASIESKTCPAEKAACVHTKPKMDNAPCRSATTKTDCENKLYLSSQKQCKWIGH
jgi:hypothetical protein